MGTRGSALNQEEWRVIRFVDGEFGKTAPPISVIPGLDVKPGYIPDRCSETCLTLSPGF
ncbi:hypothetical protein AMC83_CH00615 [Rhizobium phaseoli]|nr:hypothetical protein AMC83_CH00615 [Rhizobium phaseoli]